MANKLLDELKDTPVEFLEEIQPDIATLTEDQVIGELASAEALAPAEEVIAAADPTIDQEQEETEEEEIDDIDEEEEEELEQDQEQDPDRVKMAGESDADPNEATELEAENFLTAKQCIGLFDNVIVELENFIFKLCDIEVKKKDLHYTPKQKKLLEGPLEKALKQTKIKIASPWGAFFATFAGLEFAKISAILANNELNKKHQAEMLVKEKEILQMKWDMYQLQMQLQQYQQFFQQGSNVRNLTPQPDPNVQQPIGAQDPGNGPGVVRGSNGRFQSTGGGSRKRNLTRKPGETRGRKPKDQGNNNIQLSPTGT